MKRFLLPLLILAALLCLTGCSSSSITNPLDPVAKASSTLVPGVDTLVPEAVEEEPLRTQATALLYFRYHQEAMLASESRSISRMPSQTWEYAVVNQLLAGPGASSGLSSLFPQNTRVLSAVRQGRTLFVTLSDELLSGYPDEPMDWQESDYWREECPLRRQLCMQSLVATVTENCDVDQVQVLVQQASGVMGSLRLKQNYFLDDSPESVLVGPMSRDASLLLGPDASMAMLLRDWSSRDWPSLYEWVRPRDPVSGASRPAQRDFVTVMEELPAVISWKLSPATFTADGQCATFSVTMQTLNKEDGTVSEQRRILRLYNDRSRWLTTMAQLTGGTEVAE